MTRSQKRRIKLYRAPLIALVIIVAIAAIVTTQAQAAHSSKTFIQNATIGNQFEVSSSRLALQVSQNDAVKAFAQKMVDDHTQVGDQLKTTIANSDAQISEPKTSMDEKHRKLLDELNAISPQDFDKLYVKDQIKAHDEAVDLFKDYAKHGDNEALKNFASQNLPALEEHKKEVRQLKSSI